MWLHTSDVFAIGFFGFRIYTINKKAKADSIPLKSDKVC